jgi:aminoglycoside 6'-N-acetyltransferase
MMKASMSPRLVESARIRHAATVASRPVILRGRNVDLRPGTEDDVRRLAAILREPEVARWWGTVDESEIRQEFVEDDSGFVIEADGEVIGAIQFSEETDPMYRHAGIDLFITTPRHGQGLGSDAIRTLARYLIQERGHHRLTIDPALENRAAIRAYEKVGFRRMGVMRRYERGPDGTWHDGLLMDLLAAEVLDPP